MKEQRERNRGGGGGREVELAAEAGIEAERKITFDGKARNYFNYFEPRPHISDYIPGWIHPADGSAYLFGVVLRGKSFNRESARGSASSFLRAAPRNFYYFPPASDTHLSRLLDLSFYFKAD